MAVVEGGHREADCGEMGSKGRPSKPTLSGKNDGAVNPRRRQSVQPNPARIGTPSVEPVVADAECDGDDVKYPLLLHKTSYGLRPKKVVGSPQSSRAMLLLIEPRRTPSPLHQLT